MIKERVTHCDFCGLVIEQAGEDCPLCHYPLFLPEKEERFLLSAIDDLQRVVNYGGSHLRVSDLLTRYRSRLDTLRLQQSRALPAPAAPASALAPRIEVAPSPVVAPVPAQAEAPREVEAPAPAAQVRPRAPRPRRVFSWKSFFADQAINIVASLGAFLILVGALSLPLPPPISCWRFSWCSQSTLFLVAPGLSPTASPRSAWWRPSTA